MTLRLPRAGLGALALSLALVPFAAGSARAASKHHRHHAAKRTLTQKQALTPQRAAAPAAAAVPVPAVTSVISIGGYVFYNLTYAQAVEAYAAAVAAAPAGSTPAPVTSVSVTTTVGGGTG